MYHIYLEEFIHPDAYRLLSEHAEILTAREELPLADAILTRNIYIGRSAMEQCPNLKVIGLHGTGTSDVDLAAAKEFGITVVNAPHRNSRSVAELIVALTLNLARKIAQADRAVMAGHPYPTAAGELQGTEVSGKTVGLIGCGDISCQAADIFRAGFGCRIIAWSRSLTEEKAGKLGLIRCEAPADVVRDADIIVMGTALTPETEHLVNGDLLCQVKPGSLLINTTRGAVVDEKALYRALTGGNLAGAALDVVVNEPPTKENPLAALPNVLLTPHLGGNTDEALRRVGMLTVRQILDVLDGREPEYPCT